MTAADDKKMIFKTDFLFVQEIIVALLFKSKIIERIFQDLKIVRSYSQSFRAIVFDGGDNFAIRPVAPSRTVSKSHRPRKNKIALLAARAPVIFDPLKMIPKTNGIRR